jgi:hypothetical protein
MPRFKDDFAESRKTSSEAKQAMLERFRARPSKDDPAIKEREAARIATKLAREARIQAREVARKAEAERLAAELKAREEEAARLAAEKAELEAAERRREADEAVKLLAEQKAARDARYAARRARKR